MTTCDKKDTKFDSVKNDEQGNCPQAARYICVMNVGQRDLEVAY